MKYKVTVLKSLLSLKNFNLHFKQKPTKVYYNMYTE